MRWVGRGLLLVALTTLAAELTLQSLALVIVDRSDDPRQRATSVLCVGDSHTYGAEVTAEEAYPGRLQVKLDALAPGHYHVVNLGVPGYNTTQVLNRVPGQVRRHRASMVLVWVGVNDAWNLTEIDAAPASRLRRLDGWATRSRLYRLWRVWLHEQWVKRDLEAAATDPRALLMWRPRGFAGGSTIRIDGVTEKWESHGRNLRKSRMDVATIDRAARNLTALGNWANDAGIALAFITYPLSISGFPAANEAIISAANRTSTPVIVSGEIVSRLPPEEREFLWALHPNPAMYREIAREAADLVVTTIPPHPSDE